MLRERKDGPSLYEVLAEPTPVGSVAGETVITRDDKETVDRDPEMLLLEELSSRV